MKTQSIRFFTTYHSSCLEEIVLFLDNEAWVPVHSFSHVTQLQEFRSVRRALKRHNNKNNIESLKQSTRKLTKVSSSGGDATDSSIHSQVSSSK